MATIKPFRGYRYNSKKIENLGLVMAPPYYAIADEMKIGLYELHENNAVRLTAGMNYENDTEQNNCYTRAKTYLEDWIANDVLIRENAEAIYMYEQTVTMNETQYSNKGFIGLLKLEDFSKNGVMPCEETVSTAEKDRFQLTDTIGANVSMINCMYVDSEKQLANIINELSEEQPDMEFTTPSGIQQRVWVITYLPTIEFIVGHLKDKTLYVTDERGSYTACLEYQKKMREQNPSHTGEEEYNYTMVLLSSADEDGMVLLPVHRQVRCPKGFREEYFVAGAQDHFKVEKIIVDTDEEELLETMRKQIATTRKETRIAVYCGSDYFYRLTLQDRDYVKQVYPEKSEAFCNLDIAVLNKLIFEDLLHIDGENYRERVEITLSSRQGLLNVKDGEFDCLFLLNPVKTNQISDVVMAGEKMPEDSISIFPKPSTGIVLHKLTD